MTLEPRVILSVPRHTEVLAQGLQESRVETVNGGGEGETGTTERSGVSGTPQEGSSNSIINGVSHVTKDNWQRNDSITPPSLAESELWNLLPGTTLSDQAKAVLMQSRQSSMFKMMIPTITMRTAWPNSRTELNW